MLYSLQQKHNFKQLKQVNIPAADKDGIIPDSSRLDLLFALASSGPYIDCQIWQR